MAQVINTNSISLLAQNNLNKSQSALGTAIERLSSGLRINSAKDDAAGEAIANRFTSNINGLTQASRNANDGISLAQTTEGALDEINSNLQAVRTLTVQAQTGTNSASDLQSIQDEVTQRMAEINRISQQTDFNGVKVLSSNKSLSIQVGADDGQTISINLQQVDASTLGLKTFNVNGAQGKTTTVTKAPSEINLTDVADGGKITAGGVTTTLAAGDLADIKDSDGDTLAGTLQNGNDGKTYLVAADGSSVQEVTAYDATNKQVTLGTAVAGSVDADTGAFTPANAIAINTADATDEINGQAVSTLTNFQDASGNSITNGTVVKDDSGNYYLTVPADPDVQGDKAGYYAIKSADDEGNVTLGDFTAATVTADPDATDDDAEGSLALTTSNIQGTDVTSINIKDSNLDTTTAGSADLKDGTLVSDKNGNYFVQDADGKSYAATVSIDDKGVVSVTADSSKEIDNPATNDALATLDRALSQVDTLRSSLGAVQNRLDSTIDNLSSTTSNLSEAQSRIQDADYATEVSNMSKAQILQQAGTSVLAQANQVPQTVLSLLK
jgi:flagellin